MCGITGYSGDKEASKVVEEGLSKLEYRGYDSAGIAIRKNSNIEITKNVGTVEKLDTEEFQGESSIGHTRWATHGKVTAENAHPHSSCENEVVLVHNGIIENYQALKNELKDHEFTSETDTEVVAHLLEKYIDTYGTVEVLEKVMEELRGSFAIVAMLETGETVFLRKDSPLVMGKGNSGTFLGSDVTSFIKYTDKAVYLEDGDYGVIEGKNYEIFNSGKKVEREVEKVDWNMEQASKEGYNHYMLKEIHEQPETIKKAAFQNRSDVEEAVEMIEEARNIYLTGCGSAGIIASLGAKYLREKGFETVSELSHELEYRKEEINEDDLVIAVSQSGETADLLSVVEEVPAEVLSIVNVVGSTLARNTEHQLFVNAGPEIAVASTKATTAQLSVLHLLAESTEGKMEKGRNELIETAERLEVLLEEEEEKFRNLSDYFTGKDNVYFIGRYKGRDVAREACLKFKEVTYTPSEAFPAGEFKHGNLALVDEGTPIVSFLKERGYKETVSNAREAESRGADIISVDSVNGEKFDYAIEIPGQGNVEIYEIAAFQYISYLTSVKKGNNPDKPRNLAKSVTVK